LLECRALYSLQVAVKVNIASVPLAFCHSLSIGNTMKFSALIAVLFAVALSACGKKAETVAVVPTIAVPATIADAASSVAAAASGVAAAAATAATAASGVAAATATAATAAATAATTAAAVAPAAKK
jgi:colicin import membrane protein